ncbi:MAG: hypothetical protein R6V49_11800 [Bacteroidales bacterium]
MTPETRNLYYASRLSLIVSVLLGFLLTPNLAKAQDISEFREFEDSLAVLAAVIYKGETEAEKHTANEIFLTLLSDALSLNNSFKYPFDSLKYISMITSPDKRFRIITWMIMKENGTYEYFGFIQSFSRRKNDYEVYPLTDMSESMDSPESKVLDHKNWYGAVYYEVILTRKGGNRYYTLLGWDGNNPLIRRKLIEVLTLRSNGMPRFGQSLFRYGRPHLKRVFFEYSSLATMNLRYERQHYTIKKDRIFVKDKKKSTYKKKKNLINRLTGGRRVPGGSTQPTRRERKSYREVRRSENMIIFDNLIPMEPLLEGQRQFYVPEGNIMNAFRFSGGKWRLVEDIDARNPKHQYDKPRRRPRPEEGL